MDDPDEGENCGVTLYCSFCEKSQHEVRKLIAGPTVFICDECVMLCLQILVYPAVPEKETRLDEEYGRPR